MARPINLTTQKQEFLKELYLKETVTRVNWWHRHRQNVQTNGIPNLKLKMKDNFKLPLITVTNFQVTQDGRKDTIHETVKDQIKKEKDENTSAIGMRMRPASPRTQGLLYHGTSKEEEGRYHYLKKRKNIKPQDKYLFPLSTNWDYGWQTGNIDKSCSQHGRRCVVADTFYRKNGIPMEANPQDVAL